MAIIIEELSDEDLRKMLRELDQASQPGAIGYAKDSLIGEYAKQFPSHIALIKAPIDVYKEAATRWEKRQSKLKEALAIIVKYDGGFAEYYMQHNYRHMYSLWENISATAKDALKE